MKIIRRKQKFVDPRVQGALLERAIMYLLLCLSVIAILTYCVELFQYPDRPLKVVFLSLWKRYAPALLGVAFILPFILYDVISVSNRFVGPIHRLRRGLKTLAKGEQFNEIHFRQKDFWPDMAEAFNQVVARFRPLTDTEKEQEEEDCLEEANCSPLS